MNAVETKEAVATINRVEKQMIENMSDEEYRMYMSIPTETRKQMLYLAYKTANPKPVPGRRVG